MHAKHKRVHLPPAPKPPSDSEMLEEILRKMHALLKDMESEPKVADFLKLLEAKYRLRLAQDERKAVIDIVENARKSELEEAENGLRPSDESR